MHLSITDFPVPEPPITTSECPLETASVTPFTTDASGYFLRFAPFQKGVTYRFTYKDAQGQSQTGLAQAPAVATILAVVAGLTLATSAAVANDLYVNLFKKGKVEERQQVIVARAAAVLVGIVATLLGIFAEGVNVAVLVILAICIAASANFPVLALSLFWRRFNTGGVVGGMTLGLVSSVGLALIGQKRPGVVQRLAQNCQRFRIIRAHPSLQQDHSTLSSTTASVG